MGSLEQRIQAFVKLGEFLRDYVSNKSAGKNKTINETRFTALEQVITKAAQKNGWFTEENILHALNAWAQVLTEVSIKDWLAAYDLSKNSSKKVAIIMAGNIPLVGFHDLLAVLLTGNKAIVKVASNDTELTPFLIKILTELEPVLKSSTEFTQGTLKNFDAVIATGSNNTSRYFEYYFGHKPHIIRKNRNSVAVLQGTETKDDLAALGEDIFRYYGLGCRNVSKLFVPQGYRFDSLFEALESWHYLKDHHKYHNNYDYNKAVYLMSEFPFLDNGFFMLKEDPQFSSPIGTLFYEYYDSTKAIRSKLELDQDQIQCIVAKGIHKDEIAFGHSQLPQISDYADGVDTVEFLLKT